ncbi:MAG: sugar ABC transporter permease, partial [Acidisphaera sp.]|nr:sugar ABC transporter permease [Acidisphaera sp.]
MERAIARRPMAASVRRFASVWWFVLPGLLVYAFVTLVPAVRGGVEAFTDWDGVSPVSHFVGLRNFQTMLGDAAARAALVHTLLIAAAATVVQNAAGLLLALGVSSPIRSGRLLGAVFFAPAVVMPVVVAFLWQYIYAPDGVLSAAFDALGLLAPDWLGDSDIALWSVIAVVVWQFSGYSMVIFLAGLQGIPPEVIEASEMDGARAIRKVLAIQLPLLGPALLVNVLLTVTHGLRLFDLVWVMTQGGPGVATQTMATLIFQNAFAFNKV